ncbi:MAG: hypothetical protein CMF25_06450 [Kangiellaceae bacterium]|nr:hypothetical protein [Kangiellaceae bacterium]|tara:strand:+ start:3857 stop:6430 length:2574 start_codon:yes stop_codon:yes gene_type:complete
MEAGMNHIVLIEPSPTLRFILTNALKQCFKITTIKSYREAVDYLPEFIQSEVSHSSAIVMGCSDNANDEVRLLLRILNGSSFKHIPVLLLAEDPSGLRGANLAKRDRTTLMSWEQHQRCSEVIYRLFEQAGQQLKRQRLNSDEVEVLLVDDSRTIRVTYSKMLAERGYSVDTADSAEKALEMAQHKAYDIGIIDYYMKGANGAMLCRRLRSQPHTAHMVLAILTGAYKDNVITESLDAGATECMFKNESAKLFCARIAAMSRAVKEQRQVEREKIRLDSILSSVGDGVYGVDPKGGITFMNPAALRILGFRNEDMVLGKQAHHLFHFALSDGTRTTPDTCFLHQAYVLGDELHGWETTFWKDGRNALPVEYSIRPLSIGERFAGSVVAFRDISERKLFEEELKWQVNHDHLTKLLNRQYFEDALSEEIRRLKRSTERSAVLYMDLDRFKYINDTAGHSAGDQLLIEISQKLNTRLRSTDLVARLGGDEFAVLLRNVAGPDNVKELANQFRQILEETEFCYEGQYFDVTGSVGVALLDDQTTSAGIAMANADAACHIAKQQGRNQAHLYDELEDVQALKSKDEGWSGRISKALRDDGFELYYQSILPLNKIDAKVLEDGAVDNLMTYLHANVPAERFEVLLRLRDDDEIIHPRAFIPSAERFNLMPSIDRWVVLHALKTLSQCHRRGDYIEFAVNLSPQALEEENFDTWFLETCKRYSVNPRFINFEIKENALLSHMVTRQKVFGALSDKGVSFTADEFGRGFTSFSQLKNLPVSTVKIDGMIVDSIVHDPIEETMIKSLVEMAHLLGKKTVALHTENIEQLRKLKQLGVDEVQGFALSRPARVVNPANETVLNVKAG